MPWRLFSQKGSFTDCVPRPDIQHIWWYGERLLGFQQKIGPTGIWEEKGVRDDTHQNSVEVCPVKKCSDSAERSKRKEEWVRDEGPIECKL